MIRHMKGRRAKESKEEDCGGKERRESVKEGWEEEEEIRWVGKEKHGKERSGE